MTAPLPDPLPDELELPLTKSGLPSAVWLVALTAVGVMLLVAFQGVSATDVARWAAGIAIIAGGVIFLFLRMAHPVLLHLTRQGSSYRIGSKRWTRSWRDVSAIAAETTPSKKVWVTVTWKSPQPRMAPMNDMPTEKDGFVTSFGLTPYELAALLNRYRTGKP